MTPSNEWMLERYGRSRNGYDVMQVCINGHLINDFCVTQPEHCEDFCSRCGAKSIAECQGCKTPIRGFYHGSGMVVLGSSTPVPKYCIKCGAAYPWQEAAIENLKGIFEEGGLSPGDVQEATAALSDIVRDTPKTELASLKFKRLLGKLAKPVYEVAIKVVTDVATEAAKKSLGLP